MTSLLAFLLSVAVSAAPKPAAMMPFQGVKCPSPAVIAKSYLELETSGFRVSRQCVDPKAYPYLFVEAPPRGSDDGVPSKSVTASEIQPFTIDRVEAIDSEHYKVSFRYHVVSGEKISAVTDTLFFNVLVGPFKDRMGCALVSKAPKTLAVRAKCGH